MSKLGYTWYPKDWGNSENVFELSLSERGLYRELIDLAMLNDNKTEIKLDVWCRKFAVSAIELNKLLSKLEDLKLIEMDEEMLFIPSCEPRLNLARGGAKGGKNKPTPKPIDKPTPKPSAKQREKKEKDNTNLSVSWDGLLEQFNSITGKNCIVVNEKSKNQIKARLKEGYSKQDIVDAITNCYNDPFHRENNHKYLTLEFISRADKFEKYSTIKLRAV